MSKNEQVHLNIKTDDGIDLFKLDKRVAGYIAQESES